MGWMRRLGRTLTGARGYAERIEDEIAFHMEARTAENVARGMSEEEARREAAIRFGGRARVREEAREAHVVAWVEGWGRDLRTGWRSLKRRPGAAGAIVASLALAIGANAGLFGVAEAVMLRPAHVGEPGRVVSVTEWRKGEEHNGNPARARDWREQSGSLAALAGFYEEGLVMTGRGAPERVHAVRTSGEGMEVIGRRPERGRTFTRDEEAGLRRAAMVSDGFWRRRLGAREDIVGGRLELGGEEYEVAGVLPADLDYPGEFDVWAPATEAMQKTSRRASFLTLAGRLKEGVGVAAAERELNVICARLGREYPATDAGVTVKLEPLSEQQSREARRPLELLWATAMLVLLIACGNTAGLLLTRAAERERDSRIRAALGGGAGALLRLPLAEGLILGLAGAAAGVAMAPAAMALVARAMPEGTPRLGEARLDWLTMAFSLVLAIGASMVFSLPAGWHGVLGPRGVVGRGGGSARRMRAALAIGQMAFSAVLAAGVAMLGGELMRMTDGRGMAEGTAVTTVHVNFSWDTAPEKLRRFERAALERLEAIPGVRAAGIVDRAPLQGGGQTGVKVRIRGVALGPELEERGVSLRGATEGSFAALGIPFVKGRAARESAGGAGAKEAVVNERFVRVYLGGEEAVGKYIALGGAGAPEWRMITGVVGDVRLRPEDREAEPEVFVGMGEVYWPLLTFVLRGAAPGVEAVREAIREVDAGTPVDRVATLQEEIEAATEEPRARAELVGGFAGLAAVLAAIGLAGALVSEVVRQRKELGVRLALGAAPGAIVRRVMARGMGLAGVGIGVGLAAGWAVAWRMKMAEEVSGAGLAAAVGMGIVAALASAGPARRAGRVDPVEVLREE